MNKLEVLSTIFFLSTLLACGDDEPSFQFSGITETDSQGRSMGTIDETDWQHNDTWSEKEMNLFPTYENLNNEGIPEGTSNVGWHAFPNPTNNIVVIYLENLEGTEFIEFKLVNNNFKEIGGYTFPYRAYMGPEIKLEIELGALVNSAIYRMYYLYKFTGNEYIFKGHGDIQLTE